MPLFAVFLSKVRATNKSPSNRKIQIFPNIWEIGRIDTHKKIPPYPCYPGVSGKVNKTPFSPFPPPPPMWWDFETRNSPSLLFLPEQLQGLFLTHAAFANKQSLNQLWENNGGGRGRREKKREKWISLGKCLAWREEKTRAKYEDFPLLEFKKS